MVRRLASCVLLSLLVGFGGGCAGMGDGQGVDDTGPSTDAGPQDDSGVGPDAPLPGSTDGGVIGIDAAPGCEPGEWITEPRSTPDVYRGDATADTGGGIHHVYQHHVYQNNVDSLHVKYTWKPPGGSWTTRTVEAVASSIKLPSIAVDPDGGTHIVYGRSSQVRYAYKSKAGNAFTLTDVAPGGEPSVTVDSTGRIHVFYLNDGDVWHASRAVGGSWSIEEIDDAFFATYEHPPRVAADAHGGLHVFYWQYSDKIRYAYRPAGGSWTKSDLISGLKTQHRHLWTATAEPSGRIHVVYYVDDALTKLSHATRALGGGALTTSLIGTVSPSDGQDVWYGDTRPDLALDGSGNLHVVVHDHAPSGNKIRYARRSSQGWSALAGVSAGKGFPSIAATQAGPHLFVLSDYPWRLDYLTPCE